MVSSEVDEPLAVAPAPGDPPLQARAPDEPAAAEPAADEAAAEQIDPSAQIALLAARRNRLLGALVTLALLTLGTLAARVVVPVMLAVLLSLMLAPVVRGLTAWRVPRAVAALVVLAVAIACGGFAINALARPAVDWFADAPKVIEKLAHQMHELWRPIADASKATERITHMSQAPAGTQTVRVVDGSAPDALFQVLAAAPGVISSVAVTLLLVFVFLLHGEAMLRKTVELAPDWHAKRGVVIATRDAQRELSAYVVTISAINVALGATTAIVLWLLGIPDPMLWGGLVALLNFAPYVGPLATVVALTVVGLTTAKSAAFGLAAPAVFLGLHLTESFLVTPILAGRRLALDPIMIVLGLLLFGWMWGIAGLLIAVPLLTCVKIIASRVPGWAALEKLLSA